MKYLRFITLGILGLGVIGLAVYGVFFSMPSRTVTWASTGDQGNGIANFFKDLFTKSDISIVVFGKPGPEYNAGELTDAIMVVHFDPDTNTVHLISLPRDLWVSDDSEQFKINEAFHKNKVPLVLDRIEEMTGLSLNGYVSVDLTMIKQIVDDLGGVDVTLREAATDWVSGYTLPAGPHHLNGEDAVWLVRNRYNRQGDFFRESNQHQVIESIAQKFQQLDKQQKEAFLKKFVFRGSFLENAHIDFSKLTPYLFGTDLSSVHFKSIVLDFTTKLFKTMSLPIQGVATTTYVSALVPTAGFEKYGDIREYIQTMMEK